MLRREKSEDLFRGSLAVTHVHGWGSGLFRRSTSWYRIAKGEPVPMLSYPYSFYVAGWGMPFDRKLTSKILSAPLILRTGMSLDLEFDVEYTIGAQFVRDSCSSVLFSLSEELSLEWSDTANTFVPRTPEDDFARIEELWREGTDGFIRRNTVLLQNLARCGTEQQRHFIREHLAGTLLGSPNDLTV